METQFGTLNEKGQLINEMSIDLNNVPSNDPIAFSYGLFHGKNYKGEKNPHGSPFRELAPEYLRGFLLGYQGILVPPGTKIKKGQEMNRELSNLNTLK